MGRRRSPVGERSRASTGRILRGEGAVIVAIGLWLEGASLELGISIQFFLPKAQDHVFLILIRNGSTVF